MTTSDITKVQRNLSALVEFSRIVNSSLNLEFTLNNLLLSCFGKFLVTRGIVVLNEKGNFKIFSSKGISVEIIEAFPQVIFTNEDLILDPKLNEYLKVNKFTLVQKICCSRDCLGFIALGEKINKTEYSEEEIEFLKTILNIAATAIENAIFIKELKLVNRNLDSRINRLNSLFELSKEFGIISQEVRIGKLLLYSLLGHFMISNYSIILYENKEILTLESTIAKEKINSVLSLYDISSITQPIIAGSIRKEFPLLFGFGFELIVPMSLQGITKGVILLGKRINDLIYTEDDIEFVSSVGSLAIVSFENKKLFKEALEKQKLEEELEIAKDIQQKLLPSKLPTLNNFEIAALSVSSKQVGGDYYDVIKLNEQDYVVAIGDVSGKGVPASLLMANLQAFLKSICKQGLAIDQATGVINDLVTENTSDGRFITFFWGILNDELKSFNYVNAGHNPPLLIRNNQIHRLEKGGIILGVMKTFTPYLQEEILLQSGDLIILFTDGITEAKNLSDDEFSDERFESFLLNLSSESSDEIIKLIENEISEFTSGHPQSDDITLIVIRVN
jgi:sigma-B regulation protein RsbU (phosphoserine phosphatase)